MSFQYGIIVVARWHVTPSRLDGPYVMLRIGDAAPDFHLPVGAGAATSLADHRGRALLLIFLRHLA
jgi:hypothetical protein